MWQKYIDKALEMGATEVRVIHPRDVVTAAWVKQKCQFGCGKYGHSRCCPPFTPTWKETREVLDEFSVALLVRNTGWNSTDIARELAKMLFLDGYYKALGYGSGSCRLCKTCDLDTCRFPEKLVPSMEACGIDVFATARKQGFPIEVLAGESWEPHNTYCLLLIE